MSLHFYERNNASCNAPKQLAVLIHGYGSNGTDLISLAHEFSDILPDCHFVSPDAPLPFEGIMFNSFQWYSLADRDDEAMLAGARGTEPLLNNFIDEQLKRFKLKDNDLIVMGFSQGGMMSIHTMYRRKAACKAVVSFSGYISGAEALKKEIKSKPPILLCHGSSDTVVPYQAQQFTYLKLKALGVDVRKHTSKGLGHSIDDQCIDAAKDFLQSIIST